MTTMVRQQMVCIIAPDWPGGTALPESAEVQQALDDLFTDVRIIHFAAIALLPPLGETDNQLPSLMLELAVEEGLRPYDLLARLVTHPSGAMWKLYGIYWPEPPSEIGQRNQQLLDRLVNWHNIADGGFVGVRDRSVRQIKAEADLLEQARSAASNLKPEYGKERTPFAAAMARWAFGDPKLEWATEPAPRSYWRGAGAGIGAKLKYGGGLIVAWLGLVWLIGALARLLARADAWLFDRSSSLIQSLLEIIGTISGYVFDVSVRSLISLVVVLGIGWLVLFALPSLIPPWGRWLSSIRRELDRPTDTWSSKVTYFLVRIVVALLLIGGALHAAAYIFYPPAFDALVASWLPLLPSWSSLVIGLLVLIGVGNLLSWQDRLFPKASAWFFRPHDDDVPRGQQVHPTIEACEARIVEQNQTAHMISLTDIRHPNGWSAGCIRAILRIVTWFGHVFFTEGRLGDAPGIHFGHWHVIDNGRRLLFCSNFDGTFGGYLDDFINGASVGTTLAWRWTELNRRAAAAPGQPAVLEPRAFPPTRLVMFRGVKCELKFKSYARDSMVPHLYRYDASRRSIDAINRATSLRDAVFGTRNEANDDQIMRAIE